AGAGGGGGGSPRRAATGGPSPWSPGGHAKNVGRRKTRSQNRLYVNRTRAVELGLEDEDWVWVMSPHSQLKCQVRLMEGVNRDTVWTWNAIGKRAGAWNLAVDAPESTRGFLLNHLVPELLPDSSSYRYGNCDPVTAQAAWYDLRVRIEKALPDEIGKAEPRFPVLSRLPHLSSPPTIVRDARFHHSAQEGPRDQPARS